jgi:hypothetical protein
MINHLDFHQKNIPNMASTNNNIGIPSLSATVPPRRSDGQRYMDGLPQLFIAKIGHRQPPQLANIGMVN